MGALVTTALRRVAPAGGRLSTRVCSFREWRFSDSVPGRVRYDEGGRAWRSW
jgi:hypothetical protein